MAEVTVECNLCDASGMWSLPSLAKGYCPSCGGTGHVIVVLSETDEPVACALCKQSGVIGEGEKMARCPGCKGSGWAGTRRD